MKNMVIQTVNGEDYRIRDAELNESLKGYSPYSNMLNPYEMMENKSINSSTGEIETSNHFNTSGMIEADFTRRIQMYNTSPYFYCYNSENEYLGYVPTNEQSGGNAIVANTYPSTKYVRVEERRSGASAYVMYYAHRSDTKVPWNPIDGAVYKSPYIQEAIANNYLSFGYFYNWNVLEINTSDMSDVRYRITGETDPVYVLTDGKYSKNTGLARNTYYSLTGFNRNYCIIVYDKINNVFKCQQDYDGELSNYVVFGVYDHGYVSWNMGPVKVNGAVRNRELEMVLSDYDFGDLSEIKTKIAENTVAIGVNAAGIDAEEAARAAADTALGARIDNLVAPSGDSVAEIVDARTGYDGTEYLSLAARLNAEAGRVRNVLVVGSDGQYQTIAAAVAAAENGDIVFIKRGTYEEKVVNRDKPIHIIGESKEEVIWKYPNTEYGQDPYDCGMGSIRNLTIWAYDNGEQPTGQYGRCYCIHIDHQSYYIEHPPISNYFYCENVRFINDSNECAGLGLRNNMTMEFVNCDFETLGGNEAAFYVHSASATGAKCVLKNCTIQNNSAAGQLGALRVEGYNNTDKGCKLVTERNIVLNLGSGPAVIWQLSRASVGSWQNIPDWDMDRRSQLNNIGALNYPTN